MKRYEFNKKAKMILYIYQKLIEDLDIWNNRNER
jgi:hypothetical protein